MNDARALRRVFLSTLVVGLRIVWPILSGLVLLIVVLGIAIGSVEGWSLQESIYFAFVTGLTIGYGDFAPKLLIARGLALMIGCCGLLLARLLPPSP